MSFVQKFIFNRKLRGQLLLGFGLTLLISIVAITSVSVYTTSDDLESLVIENLSAYGKTMDQLILKTIDKEINYIQSMAQMPLIRETATLASELDPLTDLWPTYEGSKWGDDSDSFGDGISERAELDIDFDNDVNPDISKYLRDILPNISYSEIFFTDARGYVISSTANTGDFAQVDEGWWKGAYDNILDIGEFEFDESSESYTVAISVAILSTNSTKTDGNIAGVVKAAYNAQSIVDYLDDLELGANGFGIVITNTGDIVYYKDASKVGTNISDLIGESSAKTVLAQDHVESEVEIGGVNYVLDSIIMTNEGVEHADYLNLDWKILSLLPVSEIQEIVQAPMKVSLIVAILAFVFLILFAYMFSNAIVARINVLVASMNRGAAGDLTEDENLNQRLIDMANNRDEISELSRSYNSLIDNVKLVVNSTQVSVGILNSTSEDLLSGTEEINASAEEVASTSQAMSDGATTQTELIAEVNENVEKVQLIVDDIVKKIQMNTQEVAQIALQTNILALNAGIEASRAGDYGRGFAVVAENVRKLSDQSKMASERIETVADEIRDTLLVSFNRISSTMINVVSVSEETAASAEEVAAAAEEMTATIEEISTAASELNSQADSSTKTINKFKFSK